MSNLYIWSDTCCCMYCSKHSPPLQFACTFLRLSLLPMIICNYINLNYIMSWTRSSKAKSKDPGLIVFAETSNDLNQWLFITYVWLGPEYASTFALTNINNGNGNQTCFLTKIRHINNYNPTQTIFRRVYTVYTYLNLYGWQMIWQILVAK